MRRIIYYSMAAPGLDRAEMFHLLYQARVANEARGLSGILLRAEDHLLQVLEGPTWKLCAAFDAIRRDVRHTGVTVIEERAIAEQTFPAWPMRYFDDRDVGKALRTMSAELGGDVPAVIDQAVRDFFVQAFAAHTSVTPSPSPAARPSSPTLC
jgi:hypothetical protein